MDVLKHQIQRIQQQLSGLSASQKMLTGALVAIMAMTLLFWGRYAGTAEMEPLLNQPLSQSELGQIQDRLQAKGIPFKLEGDRLLVAADRQREILAHLAFEKALPRNMETGFEQIAAKQNPFAADSDRKVQYNRAKEITCAQIIGLFPGVEHAAVMIDATMKRQIGGNIEPTASITLKVADGAAANTRDIAEAAASVVAGAQAGLSPARINVVVNNKQQRLRQPDTLAGAGDEQFELKRKHELEHEQKILQLLEDVQGLRVNVSVKLNTDHVESEEEKIDAANTISKVVEEESTETETKNGAGDVEPGAVPNVGAVANGALSATGGDGGAGGGGSSSRETMERSKMLVLPSRKVTRTKSRPGEATVVSASVRVPRSYFVAALRNLATDGKAPDEAAVEAYAATKLEDIRLAVQKSTGVLDDAQIAVSRYDDAMPLVAAGVPQTASVSIPLVVGSHGKEIALAALALVSLFMLMMMVKRSAPAPAVLAAAVPMGPPPVLVGGESLAGEVGAGDPLLDGMELDEDAVKTQQMLDQVSTMVKDNPDAAASLVKRWLNRD